MDDRDTLIRYHAQQIINLASPVIPIQTADAFEQAYNDAVDGAVLTLSNNLVYDKPFEIRKSVTIKGESYSGSNRMDTKTPLPKFMQAISGVADRYGCLGLEVNDPEIVFFLGGNGGIIDGCRLLGDSVSGAHHGVVWTGSNNRITNNYMDDFFRTDQDTQAVIGWDSGGGLVIDNNYLSAAGQAIMFGGSDNSGASRIPTDVDITNNDCTKKPKWIGTVDAPIMQVKCGIEIKMGINIRIIGNNVYYAGQSDGQGGYCFVVTVRNQDGGNPWSTIRNVEIANNTGSLASGVCNILGTDNDNPSDTLDTLNIHDNTFVSMDGNLGHHRIYIIGGGPKHVTLKNTVFQGVNMDARCYFYGDKPPIGLVMAGMNLPHTEYGYILDEDTGFAGEGPEQIMKYAPDAALDNTIVQK